MKKKFLIFILAIAATVACALGLAACGGSDGTYYLYKNGSLDKSQYIKISGNKWSDDDDASGTYKLDGTNIVFYAEIFGSNEEMYSGTLSEGVLKIKGMGSTMTYCKEGSEPSSDNKSGNYSDENTVDTDTSNKIE